MRYFNPRSPRGGATHPTAGLSTSYKISIHAPHEGERRTAVFYFFAPRLISIHAPHEGERHLFSIKTEINKRNFNPRSPRGGATDSTRDCEPGIIFQSTLPTRGSDESAKKTIAAGRLFQSTLPTRGSDSMRFVNKVVAKIFQSTLPTRGSDCIHAG